MDSCCRAGVANFGAVPAVAELMDFIRFASISAQPAHADDVRRCAGWLAEHLRHIGPDHVAILPTPGHPVVYADWLRAPGKPALLVYGHYDVQPVDPLQEWQSPPFNPQIRYTYLLGRGASDDKGQMFAHVKAIEWFLRHHGRLPLNVRCIFEGEEEIGSLEPGRVSCRAPRRIGRRCRSRVGQQDRPRTGQRLPFQREAL